MLKSRLKTLAVCCAIALVYFVSARFGLTLAFEQANTSPVWPPTGVAIAAVLLFGIRVWPGIFVGALIVNISVGTPVVAAISIATGNTLEALAAGYLIQRYASSYPFLRIRHAVLFALFVATSTLISATIGVSTLLAYDLIQAESYGLLWETWWTGDAVGGLMVTPLLLTWFRLPTQAITKPALFEAACLTLATVILAALVFGQWSFMPTQNQLSIFLMPLLLLWSALRFQHYGTTIILIFFSISAIMGTLSGYGPFVMDSENESLLVLQAFMGGTMLTALIFLASQEERRKAINLLKRSRQLLKLKVTQRTEQLAQSNAQLETEIDSQKHLAKTLQSLLNTTYVETDKEFLGLCVKELASSYHTRYAMIGIYANSKKDTITTLAVWADDHLGKNFTYDLAGTPCQDVLDLSIELVPSQAAERYPDDELLRTMEIESYFGAPLITSSGELIGIVSVMDNRPMEIENWVKPVLGLFSNRISLELQRRSHQDELELAASVFRESIEAVVICSSDSRIIRVNPAFTRITGYTEEDVIGKSPGMLKSGMHSSMFYERFWSLLNETGVWQGEIIDRRKNGEVFPAWQTITVIRNKDGEIQQFISIFSDITDKKLSEARIYDLAHNDIVTGLPNRASFLGMVTTELEHAKRKKNQFAVMFLDLDNFKLINDTEGHPAGDLLLKNVAARLRNTIRQQDVLSRFGGDEFTLLLPGIQSTDEAGIVAKKMLECLNKPFHIENTDLSISASIGIGIYPDNGNDVDTLLKNADSAMYQAKQQGRANFQFFTEQMNQAARDRLEIERDLRKAITQHEFVLHYQPQIDMLTTRIIGFEALIRWQHPEKGLIPPDQFIPVAESSGLIIQIGKWVLETALNQLKQWQKQGHTALTIAVNLSSRQFMQKGLLSTVKKTLERSGVSAADLELELTESMMMENIDETIKTLQAIRDAGILLSIDDFGTGYSSLAYLKRFPLNKLKIDRSFVNGLPQDSDDAAIVKATIAIAHELNLSVVAEGVETLEQFQFLKALQCETVQGYYFSKPLPASDASSLLDQDFNDLMPTSYDSSYNSKKSAC